MLELISKFKPGCIVTTKYDAQEEWVTNSIISCDHEGLEIEIGLKQEYIDGQIKNGEVIEVRYAEGGYLYIAKGSIKEIVIAFPQMVKVQVTSLDKAVDQREDFRYNVHLSCTLRGEEIESLDYSIVDNISKTGLSIVSKHNLTLGTRIFIDVSLEDDKVLKLSGTPVRKKAFGYNIEYGVSTKPIDDEGQRLLDDFISELGDEEKNSMSIIKRLRAKSATAVE